MNNSKVLLLDLDGVLILTPPWKSDIIENDGYSAFDKKCVDNLNNLLDAFEFDIWLSSTRRLNKTLKEFNTIFRNRGITQKIKGFVPKYQVKLNRREELTKFITLKTLEAFLIIDDDKSLNGLNDEFKKGLVLTDPYLGFNIQKLHEAYQLLNKDKM